MLDWCGQLTRQRVTIRFDYSRKSE